MSPISVDARAGRSALDILPVCPTVDTSDALRTGRDAFDTHLYRAQETSGLYDVAARTSAPPPTPPDARSASGNRPPQTHSDADDRRTAPDPSDGEPRAEAISPERPNDRREECGNDRRDQRGDADDAGPAGQTAAAAQQSTRSSDNGDRELSTHSSEPDPAQSVVAGAAPVDALQKAAPDDTAQRPRGEKKVDGKRGKSRNGEGKTGGRASPVNDVAAEGAETAGGKIGSETGEKGGVVTTSSATASIAANSVATATDASSNGEAATIAATTASATDVATGQAEGDANAVQSMSEAAGQSASTAAAGAQTAGAAETWHETSAATSSEAIPPAASDAAVSTGSATANAQRAATRSSGRKAAVDSADASQASAESAVGQAASAEETQRSAATVIDATLDVTTPNTTTETHREVHAAKTIEAVQGAATEGPRGAESATGGRPAEASAPGVDQADRVRIVQRVVRAVEAAADRGGQIRMRLFPPELGSLRLEMTVRNGVMNARLEAETDSARRLLLDNLNVLREQLADRNIRIDRFDVELIGASTGEMSQHADSQQRWQERQSGHAGAPEARTRDEGTSTEPPRPVARSRQGTQFDVVI